MDWKNLAVIVGAVGVFIPEPITTIIGIFIIIGFIVSKVI